MAKSGHEEALDWKEEEEEEKAKAGVGVEVGMLDLGKANLAYDVSRTICRGWRCYLEPHRRFGE